MLDQSEAGFQVDVEARGDLQPRVLEDMAAPTPAPLPFLHRLVPIAQQHRDFGSKQMDQRREPAVQQQRRGVGLQVETVEHADHVVRSVPGLAGNPAIGREQADRLAPRIDRDRHQMGDFVPGAALQRRRLRRHRRVGDRQLGHEQRRGSCRHALGPQEQVEMAMLRGFGRARSPRRRMPVIEILGVGGRIVGLALGVAPPFGRVDGTLGDLPQDGAAALGQLPPAFAQGRGRPSLAFPPTHRPLPFKVRERNVSVSVAMRGAGTSRDW